MKLSVSLPQEYVEILDRFRRRRFMGAKPTREGSLSLSATTAPTGAWKCSDVAQSLWFR